MSTYFQFCLVLYLTTQPYPNVWRHAEERFYYNPKSEMKETFPSLNDDWSVHISVIVPAYNEEKRCNCLVIFCCVLLMLKNTKFFFYLLIYLFFSKLLKLSTFICTSNFNFLIKN